MDTVNTYTDPVAAIIAVYNGTDPRLPHRSDREHAILRARGVRWYRDNRRMIRNVADDYGLPRSVVAGVFAAYSANTSWAANLTVAQRALVNYLTGQELTGLPVHRNVAGAVLTAMDGDALLTAIGPKARKVRTFYGAFMGRSAVLPVIDRWANDIATGRKTVPNGTQYELVASYYVEAARIIGIRPEELQAATWTIWRGSEN